MEYRDALGERRIRPFFTDQVLAGDVLVGLSQRNSGQYYDLIFILESDGALVVARESKTAFDVVKRYKVADQDVVAAGDLGEQDLPEGLSTLTLWTIE